VTAVTEQVLTDVVKVVVKEVDPEKIILFGSHAKGMATPDSDVDLLIVEREPLGSQRSRRAELSRIRRTLYPFAIPMDILVFSVDEVSEWQDSINHIIAHCLREGRVLYDRQKTCAPDD